MEVPPGAEGEEIDNRLEDKWSNPADHVQRNILLLLEW